MAIFNMPYGNHGENPAMEDIANYFRAAITEAGHVFNITPSIDRNAINLVLENFPEGIPEVIEAAAKQGTKFIILVSEAVTGNTFNDFKPKERDASWYGDGSRTVWNTRFRNFIRVAETCKLVWCLVPQQLSEYATIIPSSWLHLVPTGYVGGYATVDNRPDHLKDIDILFSGSLTARRTRIIEALQRLGANVLHFKPSAPSFIRDNIVSRSKISLGIKQFDEWKYPSLTRHYYHLMNASFMLSEKCEYPCVLDKYVAVAEPETFVPMIIDTLKEGNFSQQAMQNRQRYQDEVPLKPLFAKFLDQSL